MFDVGFRFVGSDGGGRRVRTVREDGFLRSVSRGKHEPALSVLVDDVGVYYDATRPSRLEEMVRRPLSDLELARARALIAAWRRGRVSKYNYAPSAAGLPTRFVLVAGQTRGESSLRFGMADEKSFERMLGFALAENPECTVLIKLHPDELAGKRSGYFDIPMLLAEPRIRVLAEDVHPAGLLARAEAVYAVTSQLGFEGLLWGKRVRVFGLPFYAGWGLTEDDLTAPERRRPVPLENLVHGALIEYPRYTDPETGQPCQVETVLSHLARQRRMRSRFPREVNVAGLSREQQEVARSFFQGNPVRFVAGVRQVPAGAPIAVWGQEPVSQGQEVAGQVIRLDLGLFSAMGLDRNAAWPSSWVMDTRGLYYDATAPSDLEHLLETTRFGAGLLSRARRLSERIRQITLRQGHAWIPPVGKKVVLVVGQAEGDPALERATPGIRTASALLRSVRQLLPHAHIVYRPARGASGSEGAGWCDEVNTEAALGSLIEGAQAVHTISHIAGFEALLRGKAVTAWGQPFYAGWGLTTDRFRLPCRMRRLTVDELVAAALILYPAYISRNTGRYTTPEQALNELYPHQAQEVAAPEPAWRKQWKPLSGLGTFGS